MPGDLDLRLFGSIHVDRPSKVGAELAEVADGVDALFIELPENRPGWRAYVDALVRAPAATLGAVVRDLVLGPLSVLSGRGRLSPEVLAVERVSAERDLSVHRVDEHPMTWLGQPSRRGIAANWLVMLVFAVASPVGLLETVAVLLACLVVLAATTRGSSPAVRLVAVLAVALGFAWTLWTGLASLVVAFVCFIAFMVVLVRTVARRNRGMLDRIEAVTAAEGYDSACLVTGKAHLQGLATAADGRSLSVGRVHASKFLRRSDADWDDPDPAELPGVAQSRRPDGDTSSHPRPDRGTERGALAARAVAALFDLVGMAVVGPVVGVALGVIIALAGLSDATIGISVVVGAFVGLVLYTAVTEATFGRTPGKALVGLVVVSTDGSPCTWRAAIVRNLLRPVDLLGGVLALAFTRRHRRVGDLAAGTVVCRTAGENR